MPRYIRVNSLKQTFREDLRIARSWKVMFLWIPKLLGKRMQFTSPVPLPVPFREFEITPEQLPPEVAAKFAPLLQQASELDFGPPLYQRMLTLRGESVTTLATCCDRDGEVALRIFHLHVGAVHPPAERVTLSLASRLSDGRLLTTVDQRASFDPPPFIIAQRQVGASLRQLCALHRKRLEELKPASVETIHNDDELRAFADRTEEESVEHNCRRGLYEELTPDEIASVTAQARTSSSGTDLADAAVLTEIDKIQNKRASWGATLLIAILTLAAFVALGNLQWDWEFTVILAGTVLFHELGHYIAMRIFRYRDLRMFFVPLLGAAVMGRHYNVKGWKKAIVSLAGPVPGIIVAGILMFVPPFRGNPLFEKIALVSFLLNGINLLPVLPLDGGWILHTLVFSRHFVLETAFRVFAGLALIGATVAGRGKLWAFLGIVMLISAPVSHRLAKVTRRLRDENIPSTSEDAVSIPNETALAILRELKQALPGRHMAKHLAGYVLGVFEKLNATPPRALASVALITLYIASGVTAFLGTGFVFKSRAERFVRTFNLDKPPRSLEVGDIRSSGARQINPLSPCVVATFPERLKAEASFQSASQDLANDERLTLVGQTLFVSGPGVASNWPARLKGNQVEVSVERPDSNKVCIVTLTCQGPAQGSGTNFIHDLSTYFEFRWLKLWPPWVEHEMSPAERETIDRAQYTDGRLSQSEVQMFKDPELTRSSKQFASLTGRNNQKQLEQLVRESQTRMRSLYQQQAAQFASSTDPRLDKQLASLYFEDHLKTNYGNWHETWRTNLASRVRLIPSNRADATKAEPRGLYGGSFDERRGVLSFYYLTFFRTDAGLPTLIDYLKGHGCTRFRYDLRPVLSKDDDDERDPP